MFHSALFPRMIWYESLIAPYETSLMAIALTWRDVVLDLSNVKRFSVLQGKVQESKVVQKLHAIMSNLCNHYSL